MGTSAGRCRGIVGEVEDQAVAIPLALAVANVHLRRDAPCWSEFVEIAEDWTSEQLQDAIKPDQNEWVARWMSGLAGTSWKKLLRRRRFREPWDMLSVYVCIMNDSTLMACPLKQLKERVDDITKAGAR